MRILLAVDGSKSALDAVRFLVQHAGWYRDGPQVDLVTVIPPVPQLPNMSKVVGRPQLRRYYEDEGRRNLAQAARRLTTAKVPFIEHILVGPVAETLARFATEKGCDMILAGTRGMTAGANALLGSTATKLLHVATQPVLLAR
jgi:nucleotide-binding universal stress UspA family protein